MCQLFKTQDPATYQAETRPLRLHGHATSIRLETAFWDILEEIAAREGMPLARFCAILYDEVAEQQGKVSNFASFLRVTSLHYLRHKNVYLSQFSERALMS